MTTTERSTLLPAPGLDEGRRAHTIGALNGCLASMIDLALAAKQAHWNILGPNFAGLHELLDVVAAEARDWGDLLAERAVAIGGTAHGTVQDVASGSGLPPFPTDERNWQVLTREVHARTLAAAARTREVARDLDDELVTQDLCIEIVRGLEKRAWMLAAHLEFSEGTPGGR